MSNFELLILYTIINFIMMFLSYRFFGKKGIGIFIVISVIAANIQVNKGIEYDILGFHFAATMGNVMFSGIFMANDLLNEKYGKVEAQKMVITSAFFGIGFMLLMFFATLFQSINLQEYNDVNQALNLFFSLNGGAIKAILIGNIVYLISQSFDVLIYSKLRNFSSEFKWVWLRNSGSTAISQIVDSFLITYGFVFAGIIPSEYAFEMVFSTLAIKYIITVINAPLFYLLVLVKPKKVLD